MQKIDSLIRTKLHLPSIRSNLVLRPRLQQQVMHGLSGRLTLIVAPAGFGKTTLVSSCVTSYDIPVAWLSLDKDDNHAGRFLTYLIAALAEADNTVVPESAQLIAGMEQLSPEAILTTLINNLESAKTELVLVLDDYQFIDSEAVHKSMIFLLEHCPAPLHIIILTRSDPPLPLPRLRARGQTVELRAADLRFTEEEAFQFLNEVMGLHLDASSVTVLEDRTEGWIAGLQMAALSMRDRADVLGFIEGFSGTNRYILDYLLEEVLAREPEEVQSFLLQTAILNRLSGSLCDAVTGTSGGQEMLEKLERRNLFVVPLDDHRQWYRYHHLFADLLRAKLHLSGHGRAAPLLSRAAQWCEGEGQIVDAVGYAFAAQDYGLVTKLIVKHWQEMTSTGEIEMVWSWLDGLPTDTIKNNARLGVVYCWVLWLKAEMGAIEPHLVDAEHAWNELTASKDFESDNPNYALLPAELAALRAFVARHHNEVEAAHAFAERALKLAPANLPPAAQAVLLLAMASSYDAIGDLVQAADAYAKTILLGRLGGSASTISLTYILVGVLFLLGRLRDAYAACRNGLEYMQENGMSRLPAAGVLHVAMSEVLLEQNDLESAEAHLAQGMELGKRSGRLDAVRNAAHVRARLMRALSDSRDLLLPVQEAESAYGQMISPLASADLLAVKALILSQRGQLREAVMCVEAALRVVGRGRGQVRARVALTQSRVMFTQWKPDEAVEQLTQSIFAAETSGLWGVALKLRILLSLALAQQGMMREAEAELERALAFAEPEGYVRIFLDEGEPVRLLIDQWLVHADSSPLREYATRLRSQFKQEPQQTAERSKKATPTSDLIEPLTPRELDILRLVATGCSNGQIAAKLFLAEGTVKFYMHSILQKLGVHNRTQALVIAREQNLL
jgi:LuxR family maltose regulon positive regulatory protein